MQPHPCLSTVWWETALICVIICLCYLCATFLVYTYSICAFTHTLCCMLQDSLTDQIILGCTVPSAIMNSSHISLSCRRTEKSMERVLGLNQSLVDSFTRQQPTPDPSTEAVSCTAVHTSPSKLRSGQCCSARVSNLACV
jgi:hypothetical protein